MNRVVITSLGVVSPIGTGKEEFFHGIEKGTKGISDITSYDAKYYPIKLGAEAKENGNVIISKEKDRREIFLDKAFEQVFKDSALNRYEKEKRMLIMGAGIDYFDLPKYVESNDVKNNNWQKYSLNYVKMIDKYSEKNEIKGGTIVNVSACVASSQAMGLSYRILNTGEDKIIITGGIDSMLNHLHFMGFYKLGALSDWDGNPSESCRPFDKDRRGLVLGEGAVLFIFENEKNAIKSNILAEIAGYNSSIDAYMVTDPNPDGEILAKAAMEAIDEAKISPNEIDYVDMHGTGTLKNDIAECNALKIIFGNRFKDVPVFSLKAQVGHLIGGCGALEIAGVIYSIENQVIPATVNYTNPDPNIPLNVLKEPLKTKVKHVLKLNAAFGGQNTAFVIKKYE